MTQYENVTIDPTVTNGSQLAANINSWRKAALTLHSGVERPTYASAGTMWISTASSPWKLCVYDGTDDVVIGELKPDSHDFVSAGGTDYTNDLMASGSAAEARHKLGAVAVSKAVSKSGDTMTGALTAEQGVRTYGVQHGSGSKTAPDLKVELSENPTPYGNHLALISIRRNDDDSGYMIISYRGRQNWKELRLHENGGLGVPGDTIALGNGAKFTGDNYAPSVWRDRWGYGDGWAWSGIDGFVKNWAAQAGARVQHDSGVYEIGTVQTTGNNVDCPAGMFVTGLRVQNYDWAVREIYVRAKYARNR